MCCYLYITDVQQLRPFSLPFKSIFFILHVTPLSCGLLNTAFIRCDTLIVSYFSAKFCTLSCSLSEDNWVRCGATGRSVPLKRLKCTGCLTAALLIYLCCLFNWWLSTSSQQKPKIQRTSWECPQLTLSSLFRIWHYFPLFLCSYVHNSPFIPGFS